MCPLVSLLSLSVGREICERHRDYSPEVWIILSTRSLDWFWLTLTTTMTATTTQIYAPLGVMLTVTVTQTQASNVNKALYPKFINTWSFTQSIWLLFWVWAWGEKCAKRTRDFSPEVSVVSRARSLGRFWLTLTTTLTTTITTHATKTPDLLVVTGDRPPLSSITQWWCYC